MVDDEVEKGGPPGPIIVGRRSPEARGGACRAPRRVTEQKANTDEITNSITMEITGRSVAVAAAAVAAAAVAAAETCSLPSPGRSHETVCDSAAGPISLLSAPF